MDEQDEKLSKKQKQHKASWLDIQKQYDIVSENEVDIVKRLVYEADVIQTTICQQADKYKIEIFEDVKTSFPTIGLERSVWIDVVSLRRMKKYNTISQKTIASLKKSFNKAAYTIAIKSAHLTHFSNDISEPIIKLPIIDKELEINLNIFETDQQPEEFLLKIDEAADIQYDIRSVLYPQLTKLTEAFCYVTKSPGHDFKTLVDVTHYRYGGYPSENSPPRHYGVFKRYRAINLLMQRFEFDHADMWNKRFGITSNFTEYKHFTWNIFEKEAENWLDIQLLKPTTLSMKNNVDAYRKFSIEAWHIIAFMSGYVFVIDEHESIITGVFKVADFNQHIREADFTTKFENFSIHKKLTISDTLTYEEQNMCQQYLIAKIK